MKFHEPERPVHTKEIFNRNLTNKNISSIIYIYRYVEQQKCCSTSLFFKIKSMFYPERKINMKLAIIIVSVILIISYAIRKMMQNLSKSDPVTFVSNYRVYMNVASVSSVIFFMSLVVDVILILALNL